MSSRDAFPSESDDATVKVECDPLPTGEARWSPAQRFAERYRWAELLATGGMGEVRRARDADLQRDVAIKILRSDLPQADMRRRFEDESRLMGGLEHPNVPPVHETGVTAEGQPFYVMRMLEGDTLEEVIARLEAGDRETHAAYPLHRRLQIMKQLIAVLGFAHQRGVLHRDLKPANIMLGAHGEVFVLDWGISLRMEDDGSLAEGAEREGSVVGTPRYMAPEQAEGMIAALGPATDVFSLCTVFYEFMALRHPLDEATGSDLESVRSALRRPVPLEASERPSRHQDAVPRELALVIQQGLEREAALRPQSMGDLAEALDRVLDGRNRILCGQTALKRGTFAFGRFVDGHHRAAAWIVAAVGALALFGLVSVVVLATMI